MHKNLQIFCSVCFSPSRKGSGKASLESIGLKCKKEKLSWQKYPVKIKSSLLASILSIFWAGLSIECVLSLLFLCQLPLTSPGLSNHVYRIGLFFHIHSGLPEGTVDFWVREKYWIRFCLKKCAGDDTFNMGILCNPWSWCWCFIKRKSCIIQTQRQHPKRRLFLEKHPNKRIWDKKTSPQTANLICSNAKWVETTKYSAFLA